MCAGEAETAQDVERVPQTDTKPDTQQYAKIEEHKTSVAPSTRSANGHTNGSASAYAPHPQDFLSNVKSFNIIESTLRASRFLLLVCPQLTVDKEGEQFCNSWFQLGM